MHSRMKPITDFDFYYAANRKDGRTKPGRNSKTIGLSFAFAQVTGHARLIINQRQPFSNKTVK